MTEDAKNQQRASSNKIEGSTRGRQGSTGCKGSTRGRRGLTGDAKNQQRAPSNKVEGSTQGAPRIHRVQRVNKRAPSKKIKRKVSVECT